MIICSDSSYGMTYTLSYPYRSVVSHGEVDRVSVGSTVVLPVDSGCWVAVRHAH